MNLTQAIHKATINGGGTFAVKCYRDKYSESTEFFDQSERTTGFWVARPRGIENMPWLDESFIQRLITQIFKTEQNTLPYLGLWKDDFGNWSIDMVDHHANFLYAMQRGVANDQRAIWDIANAKAIIIQS